MMHRDIEVYVDDMIVKSRDRADHLAALERFFERTREFRLRLNPKKGTFGVTYGKLLGYMCQHAFERIREYLLSPPVLAPPTPGRPLLLYLSVSHIALGCMLAQLDDSGKEPALVGRLTRWLVLLTEFDIHYVTHKSIKGSIVADHLALLPVFDGRAIDDDFPYEDVAVVTSISDIIGKISPKSSSGHEFILVAIHYFTKWVEATSYARLTSSGVASFIISHIIYRYRVPHELISNRRVHFRADVGTLLQKYGATPYSLVYGIEVVLPVEIEMGSLRVALEQQISETD
ncbi:hypothetical protein VitviT2T_004299 [Vitis vinifera]|uniref:Reverse transcriptase/retrotransposon-derived protein RNase H-like domain-containing protein n=1 Tax=Vitis vinifera TaxID=29760 RepID=A0ABY9BPJ3_VITVI|nr:hypothetical protein VitviT2T_004299 [Vitis vinifera]